ncbi:alpha/beta hydrolase [Guggenheimella bovis]
MKKLQNQILGAVGLLVASATVNKGMEYQEAQKITPIGTRIPVNFQMMNVEVRGKGEKTYVLLADHYTAAPVLDFTPLTDELSKHNRVVVIEPFGHGFSDEAKEERTLKNHSEELKEAIDSLGLKEILLVARGTAAFQAMDYVNRYKEDISGLVLYDILNPEGRDFSYSETQHQIDTFTKVIGVNRLAQYLNLTKNLPLSADKRYTNSIRENMKMLQNFFVGSNTYRMENKAMRASIESALKLSIPKDIPLLLMATGKKKDAPIEIMQRLMGKRKRGKMALVKLNEPSHWYGAKELRKVMESFFDEK